MKREISIGVLLASLVTTAVAQTLDDQYESPIPDQRTFTIPGSASFGGLTPGIGREDTYYAFSGCLKVAWIKKQRFSRTQWDMAVDKLVTDCDMLPLEADEKEIIVNYLSRNYGRLSR